MNEKPNPSSPHDAGGLAAQLAAAWQTGLSFAEVAPGAVPPDAAAAYATQTRLLALRNAPVGGWKVGAKTPGGQMHCAPLPAVGVLASPATQARRTFHRIALELEIGFGLERDFTPRATPYSVDEVMSSIATMAATIEIVSSRYREWPNVDKFAQLADLQSHGALVVGASVPYRDDVFWLDAGALFTFTGGSASTNADVGAGGNPAGDPRILLPWLVNHVVSRGMTLAAGVIVTTGSYTGLFLPDMPGTAVGRIAGLPPVTVTLT